MTERHDWPSVLLGAVALLVVAVAG